MAPSPEDEAAAAVVPASSLQLTPLGAFDGTTYHLRSFPVHYRWAASGHKEKSESGSLNGVDYQQTMGRMVLTYPLTGNMQAFDEDDFKVEMSCWQLQVSAGGKAISELTGELFADILRDLSWWKVDDNNESSRDRTLVIHLTKATHRAWAGPWYAGGSLNPHKKQTFAWGPLQVSSSIVKELRVDSESLRSMEPGEPEDWSHEICTALTPQQICTGLDLSESEKELQVIIHLDQQALTGATARVPLEEVFAADISADSLAVSLRGDSFGICSGRLAGLCVPELSTWQVRSLRRKKLPKECDIKAPAFFNPALCIRLTKARTHQGLWGDVFQDMTCTEFSLPREEIDWEERTFRCMALAPGNHGNAAAKAQRAQALVKRVECSQDLLLNRVIIQMHLEEQLPGLCEKFRLQMGQLFALKVGATVVSVSFVADCEYLMCLGGLGGACVPESSSWEVFMDEGGEEEGAHPVLKLGLAKAEHCRGRWSEVFTRWQPWQLSEKLREASNKSAGELSDLGDFGLEDDAEFEGLGE